MKDDTTSARSDALAILRRLGVADSSFSDTGLEARSPVTGEILAHLTPASAAGATAAIGRAAKAFETWRSAPAPRRGELVRLFAEELRAAKTDLGRLVTLEAGKI